MGLEQRDGIAWDGKFSFGVMDADKFNKMRLQNEQAFFDAIRSGEMPWKRLIQEKNKVTNFARSAMAQFLISQMSPVVLPSAIELGTGTGTPAATDPDLWSPSVPTLKPCAYYSLYMQYYAQFITTWYITDPVQGTWSECGLFDANSNLWAHGVMNLQVNVNEILVAQWSVNILGS
jgi:hypothetical protein